MSIELKPDIQTKFEALNDNDKGISYCYGSFGDKAFYLDYACTKDGKYCLISSYRNISEKALNKAIEDAYYEVFGTNSNDEEK